ncbi:PHD and RING finger domain-containing protein 1 [Nematolebias whitei]|uniref:PHD and RING finger domain-containing protein 1 n=1 Tax=Nematolebias whitei TaxID=451745 RepID=UPI00189A2A7C|nr:PHD and RING finger domain-containing protein 1 [Nematolebias whitei]
MDEDDSQDEQINPSSTHNKGKRAAMWAISDDSDDLEEESEEGESDSGDEEEECDANGDDDEDGNEEEDDEEEEVEEEEDAKLENGTFGGTSADLEGMSSDEDSEKCPICLNSFNSQPVATPENCEHYFCLDCILEWAKNANSCPVDRLAFNSIHLRKCYGGRVKKMITVQKPMKAGQEETVNFDLEQTNCEVCGGSDREDRLLLCDGCDAGYHMECLTPPLDSVPVEEWFCPECEANNRHSSGSGVELSETDGLSSPVRPATSRAQTRAVGPTRAIARTQQSERVRANVNRHRITQARTSQLAPTYLIQSTWLDETINAVVAGLNTAVYVRDITPRVPSSHRRKTRKRRKVKRTKTTSTKGKNGRVESTGIKRRKRRVRRTRSKKKLVVKKAATPRSRIANNLGIVKDKKSSSLPVVYRPSEHTLSNMRADIGAASLSIYGDPFDLDPFVDHEELEQEASVTSLLEAKRRGISRSALRSHQPVARPVTASLSRSSVDVPHAGGVVEAAPVPDLLGSILSGQSMLLMDSSDVVINRDGSLKASKPTMLSSSRKSSSGDASALGSSGFSSNMGDNFSSPHHNSNLPGSFHSSVNGLLTQQSTPSPSFTSHSANPIHPTPSFIPPLRGNVGLPPPCPNRPTSSPCHQDANGVRSTRETTSSSVHPIQDSNFKSKEVTPSQSQPKKTSLKPTWVDVAVLPRIPKIKREGSNSTNDGTSQSGSYDGNKVFGCKGGSSSSSGANNGSGLPEGSINSLSGDKGRQQSVDQQKSHSDSQTQQNRPDRASSSSSFSNSFSSSSSGTSASQPQHALFSSSSAVSFRIKSSGNSWRAKRLSFASPFPTGSSKKEEEEEAKKKQLHKDNQKLLTSKAAANEEQDDGNNNNNVYDPFNPTLSDPSTSGDEAVSPSFYRRPLFATRERRTRFSETKDPVSNQQDLVHVKTETQETEEEEEEEPGSALNTVSQNIKLLDNSVQVEEESELEDANIEKQTVSPETNVKQEPNSDESEQEESEEYDGRIKSENEIKSEVTSATPPVQQSFDQIEQKVEGESGHGAKSSSRSLLNYRDDSPASRSTTTKKRQQEHIKSDLPSCSKSPSKDLDSKKKTSKASKEQQSSSSETDRDRREYRHGSDKRSRNKEKYKDGRSRRSRSRERRRAHSTSDSSQPNSPERTRRKRRWSQSRSADETRRRSRSRSSSSSRERSRTKRYQQRSKERSDHREKDYERRRISKDKRSVSRSKSRSRSRERRKEHSRHQRTSLSSRGKVEQRSKDERRPRRSRSRSRDRRKDGSSRSTKKPSNIHVSSFRDTNRSHERTKDNNVSHRNIEEAECAEVNKQDVPSSVFTSQVKKERSDSDADSKIIATENQKQIKIEKEINEKAQSVDMFEDFPITKPGKSEESDSTSLAKSKNTDEAVEDPCKTESYDITNIKSEPSPSVLPSCTLTTLVTTDVLEDPVPQSEPVSLDSDKEQDTAGLTAPTKQESSDSDEDFNVDLMLDNLDYVKSDQIECSGAAAKEEKEVVQGKEEEEPASTAVGLKSKTQVKRVTWNIQEPEGPLPEKSPSKLALYKLKLKQEGSRKQSLAVQAASQEIVGAASDPSKRSAVGLLDNSSSSTGFQPGESSTTGQGEAEEGDFSRKDKYLKKLHMQERAVEEVKLAIKPFYQNRDINKEEYKDILRKAVQKVCHSKSGEINPVKVGNLIKAYVEKYKHARKHKKGEDFEKVAEEQNEPMDISASP